MYNSKDDDHVKEEKSFYLFTNNFFEFTGKNCQPWYIQMTGFMLPML